MTAEVALASLKLLDKVRLIQQISASQNTPEAKLDSYLLLNKHEKAEQLLRNSSNAYLVVRHFTRAFKFSEAWNKAQECASKDASLNWLQDYVLYKRKRFLEETCDGKEFNDFFRRLKPSDNEENVRMKKKAFKTK